MKTDTYNTQSYLPSLILVIDSVVEKTVDCKLGGSETGDSAKVVSI